MARDIDEHQVRQLLAEGVSQREIGRRLDIPRTTLQDFLKRPRVPEVYQSPPETLTLGINHGATPSTPAVAPGAITLAELNSIKTDLLEVAQWWRARKMHRVDSGGPRETQRWTVHVDKRWVEAVKATADTEGVSQAEIVDRALRQFFEGH